MNGALADLSGSWVLAWVVLPILIFVARVCDVTIGTIRIISIGRGNRILAPILGFFEVLIWLLAIQQVIRNLSNVLYYVAYGAGFAAGTLVGIVIEEKLALGVRLVRVVTGKDATDLVKHLRSCGYGVTTVLGEGSDGPVHVIYTIVRRADIEHALAAIRRFNPRAFYSIEDVRFVSKAVSRRSAAAPGRNYLYMLRWRKKAK